MSEPIETMNDHLVGSNGAGVVVTLPPMGPMSNEEALRLAAWLVICAQDYDAKRFGEIFEAVRST
jgi:hypothetical protein